MGIVGLVVILTIIALLTISVGSPIMFWDTPSHIFVFGFAGGCLLLSRTSIRLLGRSLRRTLSEEETREAVRGWRNARVFAMSGGCLGTLIGVMANVHAYGADEFGLGIRAALVSLFLAMVVGYGFCLPIQVRLENRLAESEGGEARSSEFVPALVLVFLIWLLRTIIDYLAHP